MYIKPMHTRLYLCFCFALPVRIVSIHLTRLYLMSFFFFCFFIFLVFGLQFMRIKMYIQVLGSRIKEIPIKDDTVAEN